MTEGSEVAPGLAGEMLSIARRAAAAGAAELLEREGTVAVLRSKSSPTDPVTEADEASELAIRSLIASERPDDGVLGEEGGEAEGSSGFRWIVDPLDGTVNYLFGHPQWCVSVAVEDGAGPLVGVVLDPSRGEEFSVVRGAPPMLDGVPFQRTPVARDSGSDPLEGVLLATGFHYSGEVRASQGRAFAELIPRVRDIRRGGSAALDLCWAAIARVDAYGEHGVREWDVAAGGLLCLAAGLDVEVVPAADGRPAGLVAGEPAVVRELAAVWGGSGAKRPWPGHRLP